MVTKTRRATGYKNTWLQKEREREKRDGYKKRDRERWLQKQRERFGYKTIKRDGYKIRDREWLQKDGYKIKIPHTSQLK